MRARQLRGVPIPPAQKAVQKAKCERSTATQQARVAAFLRALVKLDVDLTGFVRELPFYGDKTSHPWRFDLAELRRKVVIEIDGGGWGGSPCPVCGERPGGRHSRGDRERERLKLNSAAALGWVVLSFSGTSIDRRVSECAVLVKRTLVCRSL